MTHLTSSAAQLRELVWLNRRFGTQLSCGVSIHDALLALQAEASPEFQTLIAASIVRVDAGGGLADAMADYPDLIPPLYREWVRLAEDTGTLDIGSLEIAELLEPLAAGGGDRSLGWDRIEHAVSLIQFTRRCAEFLEKGLEWWRVLYLLIHEAPPNFAGFIQELLPKRNDQRGWLTLWQRMEERPAVFSPFYRAMVRLGWESRAMDEAMRNLADLLYEDWRLARRCGCYAERASLIIDHGNAPADYWHALTPEQAKLTTVLFCRAASMLLSAGHDTADALSVCALLLPRAQQQALLSRLEKGEDDVAASLADMACFSPFVLTLLSRGQERGRVEYALAQAANVLHAEMEG